MSINVTKTSDIPVGEHYAIIETASLQTEKEHYIQYTAFTDKAEFMKAMEDSELKRGIHVNATYSTAIRVVREVKEEPLEDNV